MQGSATLNPPAHRPGQVYRRMAVNAAPQNQNKAGFVLFLLVNAVMFIRPAEILPPLKALPIYNVLIVLAILASAGVLIEQLTLRSIVTRPQTFFVIALLGAVVLSHLNHVNFYLAKVAFIDFVKIVLYFLLLIGLVDSTPRLRLFLKVVYALILATTALALLRYHGIIQVIDISAAADSRGGYDEWSGARIYLMRLQASGIFSDPNDFSCVLAAGALLGTQFVLETKSWGRRILLSLPVLVCGYGLALTYSRGGFLALVAGSGMFLVTKVGIKKSIPLGLLVLPALLVAFGGRMTSIDFSDQEDTAAGRVQVWANGFELLRSYPLFGIGWGQYLEELHIVAHNSFVHAYVETGLFGGTCFAAAFAIPMWVMWRQDLKDKPWVSAELRGWRPCLLAVMTAYAVGLCSLSRSYTVSTYLILGIGGAYIRLLAKDLPAAVPPLSGRLFVLVGGISAGWFVFLYVFTRLVT